ncbi:MAG: membrane protein insertase YidC [Deltaproteobacteria bacterium]|nr:membrane protein insertase YidC [Deltaproteobacteria bacterium]MBW2131417.1 membrane protein insertase YidC [Deltaproteobacteria bacterium]
MEQGRVIIAIALSFLVFLVWNFFFVETKPAPQSPGQPETQETRPESTPATGVKPEIKEPVSQQDARPAPPVLERPMRTITVDTPLYRVKLSEKTGVIREFTLKHYRESVEKDSPLKTLISEENPFGTVRIDLENKSMTGFEDAVFSADVLQDTIRVTDAAKHITFSWRSPNGVVMEKRYTFSPKRYLIELGVGVKNRSDAPWTDRVALSLYRKLDESERGRYGFTGPSAMVQNSVEEVKIKKIQDKPLSPGSVKWWAIEDRYFMSAAVPPANEDGQVRFYARENGIIQAQFVQPSVTLGPREEQRFDYRLFIGPKSMKVLKETGYELDEAVNFGMFDFIAKPCVWLMNQIYRVIPNYGVAIIILTLLSKVLLWPLGNKSYKSMSDMKKLQPLMAEIREKYKNDKKKQQQEIMSLYRTYKINPLGGCLPMVAQIPVFFALYRMLYEAIELRHAPFFGWINDLSAPDRLFRFDFSIPFMQPPYGIPVLTLVMGASMLLQQRMSPPPGDPSQAKMMMLMPLVFTVIFINFSSGLVLYWLVNNLFSIGQQYYVTKKSA